MTASTHTRQKRCDFWGLVIKRQCSFLLAFGALSFSVKSLMTLQPPSWRDPMERIHREGDRGSPRSWACVTSPGSRNVSEDVSEMTLALEIIWLQTHKRLWARNMLLSNSWIQRQHKMSAYVHQLQMTFVVLSHWVSEWCIRIDDQNDDNGWKQIKSPRKFLTV